MRLLSSSSHYHSHNIKKKYSNLHLYLGPKAFWGQWVVVSDIGTGEQAPEADSADSSWMQLWCASCSWGPVLQPSVRPAAWEAGPPSSHRHQVKLFTRLERRVQRLQGRGWDSLRCSLLVSWSLCDVDKDLSGEGCSFWWWQLLLLLQWDCRRSGPEGSRNQDGWHEGVAFWMVSGDSAWDTQMVSVAAWLPALPSPPGHHQNPQKCARSPDPSMYRVRLRKWWGYSICCLPHPRDPLRFTPLSTSHSFFCPVSTQWPEPHFTSNSGDRIWPVTISTEYRRSHFSFLIFYILLYFLK